MSLFVADSRNQNSWIGFNKMDVGVEFWVVGFHNVRRCSTAAVRDQFPSTSFPHVSHLWCGRDFMDYLGIKQNRWCDNVVQDFSTLKFVRKVSQVWLAKRRDSYYAVCGEDLFRWFSITKIYWLCDLNIRDQTQSQKPARDQPKDPIINSLQGLQPIFRQFIRSLGF